MVLVLVSMQAQGGQQTQDKAEQLKTLIKGLGDDDPEVRGNAQDKIVKFVKESGADIKKLLVIIMDTIKNTTDQEIKTRLEQIFELLPKGHWEMIPESPLEGRYQHSAIIYSDNLVIWGGHSNGKPFDNGAIYDFNEKKWKAMAKNTLEARWAHSASVFKGKLVIWGGWGDGQKSFNDGAIYDISKDEWGKMAESPLKGRNAEASVIKDGKIYIWGGNSGKTGEYKTFNDGAVYDIKKNTWTLMSDSPLSSRWGHGCEIAGNKIIIWGGRGEGGKHLNDGGIYDIEKNSWKEMKEGTLSGRWFHSITIVGGKAIMWGGYGDAFYNNGAIYDIEKDSWTEMKESTIQGRWQHAARVINNKVLIFGGSGDTYHKDGAIYDLEKERWHNFDSQIEGRVCLKSPLYNDKLIIWGGQTTGEKYLNNGTVFELPIIIE